MKITIENFGAIKYFVFDTEKDLTLIFGKNSVGKSYAISLVYLVLKNILELRKTKPIKKDILYFLDEESISEANNFNNYLENNNADIDISKHFEKFVTFVLNEVFIPSLNDAMENSFYEITNLQNKFCENELKISLEFDYIGKILVILGLKETYYKRREFVVKSCSIKHKLIITNSDLELFDYDITKEELIHFYSTPLGIGYNLDNFFEKFSKISLYNQLQSINNIHYLPASRSGLYQALSAFGQIVAELSKSRSFISRKIELPSISESVADYFLNLSNIETSYIKNNEFLEYASEIEESILQGKVEFDDQSKKIYFIPNETDLKLDLSAASSMVSEIAPIVSYLKYILAITNLKENKQVPILFIEEPEAHLHPETQVKLMRVFARLVKDNKIKLVMTSHSNYIFNAASNLVMDNKIPADKFEAVLFKMTEEGSVAQNMATDEYGIDDDNFIDVAESLYEEKIELINKLNG